MIDWRPRDFQHRLTDIDDEFKTYQMAMVDYFEEEEDLENKQAALDNHDSWDTHLFNRFAHLVTPEIMNQKGKAIFTAAEFAKDAAKFGKEPLEGC